MAVEQGHADIVKDLVEKDVNVDAADKVNVYLILNSFSLREDI